MIIDYRQGLLPYLRPSFAVPVGSQERHIQVALPQRRRHYNVTKPASGTTAH